MWKPLVLAAMVGCAAEPEDAAWTLVDDQLPPGPGVPSSPVVDLSPATPTAATGVRIELVQPSVDPDGDPVRYGARWQVNGMTLVGQTGRILAPGVAHRGDLVEAVVVATDGANLSAPASTGPVVIENSPPDVTRLRLSTRTPQVGERLTLDLACDDPDGDVVFVSVRWAVNGVVAATGPVTFDTATTAPGDRIQAELRCQDPMGASSTRRSAVATVQP